MKLSQKIKDIFDIIRAASSYVTLFIIGFTLIFSYSISEISISNISEPFSIIIKILGVVLIISPFLLYYKDWIRLRYTIISGKLSGFIIEKQEVVIDILSDTGDKANIYQKIYFHKFSNKTRVPYLTKIDVGGKITADSIQSINCYYRLNNEQNSLEVSYVNKTGNLNKVPNFFKKNDKFMLLYATLENTFDNNIEEFWDMSIENLCQDYSLEIIIPKSKRYKGAKFYRVNGSEEVVDSIQPLIIQENDKQKLVLRIMNFDKNEKYRIKWSLY